PIGQLPSIAAQGRCTGRYISLPVLVGFAYDVHPQRVRGVPDWRPAGKPIDTGFQIDAKADDPSMTTVADLKQMLKTMLTDRFKLEIHRETTECSGYVLSVSSNGLRLSEARPEDEAPPFRTAGGGKEVLRGKSTMASFANLLTDSVGAPVADRTSLPGVYDIALTLNRVFVSPLTATDGRPREVSGFAERSGTICGS